MLVLKSFVNFQTFVLALFLAFAGTLSHAQDWLVEVTDTVDGIEYDPSPAGTVIRMLVTVQNDSVSAAPETTLSFEVPQSGVPGSVTLVGTSSNGANPAIFNCLPTSSPAVPVLAGTTVTCTVPSIPGKLNFDDEPFNAQVILDFQTTAQTSFTVTPSVPVGAGEVNTDNNTEPQPITINAGVDLDVDISTPSTTLASGEVFDWTIDVTNFGPNSADSYVLTIPAPTNVINIVAPAGCSLSAGNYTCNISAPIAPTGGTAVPLTFTGQIDIGGPSDVTLEAFVGSSSPLDPNAENDSASLVLSVEEGTDAFIGKSRTPSESTLLVGELVTFTLNTGYIGNAPTDILVVDTLPANYRFEEFLATDGYACTAANLPDLECTLATAGGAGLAGPQDMGDIVFTATLIAPGASIQNTAEISFNGVDSNPANNIASDTAITVAEPFVDLVARKTGPSPRLVVSDQTYVFGISARNEGNADFVGTLTLTDTIPAGMNVVSLAPNGASCTVGGNPVSPSVGSPVLGEAIFVCSFVYTEANPLPGSNNPASSARNTPTINFGTRTTAEGTITNTVTVLSGDADIDARNDGNNNTATVGVTSAAPANSADLVAVKSLSPTNASTTAVAGTPFSFDLEIQNRGPQESLNVRVTDTLSNLQAGSAAVGIAYLNTSYNSCTAPGTGSTRSLTCNGLTVPVCGPGSAPVLGGPEVACPIIRVTVVPGGDGTLNGSGLIQRTNTFRAVSQTTPDPTVPNDASVTYFMEPRADVTVSKTAPSPVNAGQDLSYVVTATNRNVGLSSAQNVQIVDTLPPNVRLISVTPASPTTTCLPIATNTLSLPGAQLDVTCNFGTLPPNSSRNVTILVRPLDAAVGTTLVNNVAVSTSTIETDTDNNTAIATTLVNPPITELSVNKSDSVNTLTVGEDVIYTVRVNNTAASAAQNVVVTDNWPAEAATGGLISFRSVTPPAGGTCSPLTGQVGAGDAPVYGTEITCTVPFLEGNSFFEFTLRGTGVRKGDVRNFVNVFSNETLLGYEIDPDNNETSEGTTVRTRSDVAVVKTAPASSPSVGDVFDWTAVVSVPAGIISIAEADGVVFTDRLPVGMVLAGAPTAVASGTSGGTLNTCTGPIGTRDIRCEFGTILPGGAMTITIPVRVNRVTSEPQRFTNTATVSTISFDSDPDNNTSTAFVDILSSSISGNVFRDFADDVDFNGGDSNIEGVLVTLTGTVDGVPIDPITLPTDADGNFAFLYLAAGEYTVTRGATGEPPFVDGTNTVGNIGGSDIGAVSPTENAITGIVLPDNTDHVDNIFRIVPTARIGLAKSGAITVQNIDGSFDATFTLVVENLSLETLESIEVVDNLTDGPSPFGSYVAAGPLTNGDYTILPAGVSGSCTVANGTANGAFNGSGQTLLVSGVTLAPDATCTVIFTARIFPAQDRLSGPFINQAEVTGTGVLSGQEPDDLSDDGSVPDTNGNGVANESGENDPTVLSPSTASSITLVKVGDISALDFPLEQGDLITYRFTVQNTGDLTLTDIEVRDPMISADVIGTIARLDPLEVSAPIVATYAITLDDLDAGEVVNTATVVGTDPFGRQPTDVSGTAFDNDIDTTTTLPVAPGISLVKTAVLDSAGDPTRVGDTITYSFTITNTGNVRLFDVLLTDPLSADAAFTFAPGTVNPIASLDPGAANAVIITATYIVDQDDIDAGEVLNTASVVGTAPDGGGTFTDDSSADVPLNRVPLIETTKTQVFDNLDGLDSICDVVTYTITVENIGNVPLTNVAVVDTLTDLNGDSLDLTTGPTFEPALSDAPEGELAPGEIATYSATFVLDLQAINARGVSNTVLATGDGFDGSGPPGAPVEVSDVSDDGIDSDGNTEDDPTVLPLAASTNITGLTMVKTTPLQLVNRGDVIPYTITLTNENIFVQGPFDLVDRLPNGMIYIPGSATIDGVAADVTFTAGRVTWSDVTVPAEGTTEVTLNARILNGARAGDLVNTVSLLDPTTGRTVIADATATVRIAPEAVFECSDIVGRVFNDVNGNGYQDAPDTIGRGQISDQSFEGGKGKLSPEIVERDEVGLRGVRLATVDGTVITTDENGLFSVPCAALPATGGSNFILKVDERSLPAGYRMTTENPRVTRVTPGTMTEMNFGAAVALQVVRVDLTAASLVQTENGAAMSAALRNGLLGVLEQIAGSPSNMVLSFYLPQSADADAVAGARRLLDMVEDQVRDDWRDIGRVRLRIEQSIVRVGQ